MIGGGLSNHEPLYRIVRKHIEKHTFSDTFMTAFVKNRLGDSAGVIGAQYYLLAHDFNLHLMEIKIMDKLQTKSVKIEQTIRLL